MPRRADDTWVALAARIGGDLPTGKKGRRAEIVRRCEEEGHNAAMLSRMITAWQYATKIIDQNEISASHKTVEMLMTLERIDGAKAASARLGVLRGEMTRPALEQILRNATAAQQALQEGVVALPLGAIIDICLAGIGDPARFLWTEAPNGGVGYKLSADAEFSHTDVDFDDEQRPIAILAYKWALAVSPHVACSRIFGLGENQFLLVIIGLCQNYDLVSVFCSSEQEMDRIKDDLVQCAMPLAQHIHSGTKLSFHTLRR